MANWKTTKTASDIPADEARVQRRIEAALVRADWPGIVALYEQHGMAYPVAFARVGRRTGLTEEIARRMVEIEQEDWDWEPEVRIVLGSAVQPAALGEETGGEPGPLVREALPEVPGILGGDGPVGPLDDGRERES